MSAPPIFPSSEAPDAHDPGAQSPAMRALWALAARVAPIDSTVLITGESGVGKERLAQWLHASSPRAQAPFEPVNCAALPETLFETALFGHARGAFTGAAADQPGLFEAADGGTLFLDEIGEVSLAMQAKLLRVIQERELRRVGETRIRRINVRLVAATNRDLRAEVIAQRFREDLYLPTQRHQVARAAAARASRRSAGPDRSAPGSGGHAPQPSDRGLYHGRPAPVARRMTGLATSGSSSTHWNAPVPWRSAP